MNCCIKAPNILKTCVKLPASKSISNRVLIINALCGSQKDILNVSDCDDTDVMTKALSGNSHDIDIKAAGTAMRFLTAYISGRRGVWTITGTERMRNRPIKLLVDALTSLGAEINYIEKEGFPPLKIKGKTLLGGEIFLEGSVSSQYISALLMIAPTMTNGLKLHLTGNVISKPYINLTIQLMRQFGVIVFEEGQTLTVPPQQYSEVEKFTVESDWSAASYWYEMIALCKNNDAEICLSGLTKNSLQGDSSIVDFFDCLGVKTTFMDEGVMLTKKPFTVLKNLDFDFVSMPDMAQTAVVTCAMLGIPFCFRGLQTLKIKETDRLTALQTELRKFGYMLVIRDESILEWNGEMNTPDESPVVATYEDHRMAMSFAPIAFCRTEGVKIENPEVVSKSYPKFWEDLADAGFSCE